METGRHGDMKIKYWEILMLYEKNQTETEAQAIFLIRLPFSHGVIGSFFACPFVNKETNGNYPFAKDLNGFAHICELRKMKRGREGTNKS
jgi:hypothetical protein